MLNQRQEESDVLVISELKSDPTREYLIAKVTQNDLDTKLLMQYTVTKFNFEY